MERIEKDEYYLNIAKEVAKRSTCLRRLYGALIVKNDEIISTGYNGSPRGATNCIQDGICLRAKLKIPHGEKYELCKSVHAEANAIISAARRDMIGATLYLVGMEYGSNKLIDECEPCAMCKRLIINAGIKTVIAKLPNDGYSITETKTWLKDM